MPLFLISGTNDDTVLIILNPLPRHGALQQRDKHGWTVAMHVLKFLDLYSQHLTTWANTSQRAPLFWVLVGSMCLSLHIFYVTTLI